MENTEEKKEVTLTPAQVAAAEVKAAYKSAVESRVAANGHSGWGGADSVAVIEAISDVAYSSNEGFDAVRKLVMALVNPSAFRQTLEKLKPEHSCWVRPGEKGKRGSNAGVEGLA